MAVVVAIAMSVWCSRQTRLVTTYGSARWADADDVRKAGLTVLDADPTMADEKLRMVERVIQAWLRDHP